MAEDDDFLAFLAEIKKDEAEVAKAPESAPAPAPGPASKPSSELGKRQHDGVYVICLVKCCIEACPEFSDRRRRRKKKKRCIFNSTTYCV